MTRELVVARYREPLGWLPPLWAGFDRVTVYDTSCGYDGPLAGLAAVPPHVHVRFLPNVGREAHAFAWHARERFADLCDEVVFARLAPLAGAADPAALAAFCRAFFGVEPPPDNAQPPVPGFLAVAAAGVRRFPRETYAALLATDLGRDVCPEEALFLDRLWAHVWA